MKAFYKITNDKHVSTGMGIEVPKGYTEYIIGEEPQELLDALAEEPTPVPQKVSVAQGQLALIDAGLWDSVIQYIESLPDDVERKKAEIALHKVQEYHRNSPFLNQVARELGISDQQLDSLFIQASTIAI